MKPSEYIKLLLSQKKNPCLDVRLLKYFDYDRPALNKLVKKIKQAEVNKNIMSFRLNTQERAYLSNKNKCKVVHKALKQLMSKKMEENGTKEPINQRIQPPVPETATTNLPLHNNMGNDEKIDGLQVK